MVELPKAVVSETRSPIAYKVYFLIGLSSLIALASGYFFSIDRVALGIFLVVIYLAFFIIEVMLLDEGYYLAWALLGNVIGLALFFYGSFSWYLVGATIFLAVVLAFAGYRGKREMQNMIKLHFFKASRMILGPAITAVVIFFGLLLILNNDFAVRRESVDRFVEVAAAPVLRRYVPAFTPEMKTGDFMKSMAQSSLAGQAEFTNLPPQAKNEFVNQSAVETEKGLEEFLGAEIDPGETVAGNIYNVISFKLAGLTPQAKFYLALALVGIIWISVKSLEFILYLPLALLAFIIYEVLLATNSVVVQLEVGSREVVSIR